MTDPTNLTPRARCLLERIQAEGGEWMASYAAIADACGLARSTAQLAVSDLATAGLITVGESTPRHGTLYRLVPTRTEALVPTRTEQLVPTRTEALSSDAPEGAPAPASAGAQFPLPTPIEPSAATLTAAPLASAPAHTGEELVPTELVPTGEAVPIGRLAVAAATEAAAAAGRSIEASLRGRIGSAAQRLSGDGEEVATILAAARRLGAGGYADLYTATRAVKDEPRAVRAAPSAIRTAELMPTGETVKVSPRIAAVVRLVRGTWPRADVDAALWEEKLGKVQERFLLAAVDAIAMSGADFAPTWGQVYGKALEVGQPMVLAERAEAAWQRERARLSS